MYPTSFTIGLVLLSILYKYNRDYRWCVDLLPICMEIMDQTLFLEGGLLVFSKHAWWALTSIANDN